VIPVGTSAQYPIEEVMQRKLEVKRTTNWGEFLSRLTQEKIKWHPSWQQKESIIYYCGNYPNVALIGIKGCVDYNLILAQRQFGYPIRGLPIAALLTTLLAYYGEGDATKTLRHIRSAWKRVIHIERDSRAWGIDREIPYHQWSRRELIKSSYLSEESPLSREMKNKTKI